MLKELRSRIEQGTVTLGTDVTMKGLKSGELEKVFVTKNCPEDVIAQLRTVLGDAELVQVEQDNDEFGIMCKRSHNISVLGFKK